MDENQFPLRNKTFLSENVLRIIDREIFHRYRTA
jgi:hypothetical protein